MGRQHRKSSGSDDEPDARRSCSQVNDPLAQRLTGDADKLARRTPSWKEFQPRLGFAYDVNGDARLVLRGGYGLFYDQLFQNLTLFSHSQSGPEIFSTLINLTNSAVGVGQLPSFRYGVDPLPAPPTPNLRDSPGRLVRPHQRS